MGVSSGVVAFHLYPPDAGFHLLSPEDHPWSSCSACGGRLPLAELDLQGRCLPRAGRLRALASSYDGHVLATTAFRELCEGSAVPGALWIPLELGSTEAHALVPTQVLRTHCGQDPSSRSYPDPCRVCGLRVRQACSTCCHPPSAQLSPGWGLEPLSEPLFPGFHTLDVLLGNPSNRAPALLVAPVTRDFLVANGVAGRLFEPVRIRDV